MASLLLRRLLLYVSLIAGAYILLALHVARDAACSNVASYHVPPHRTDRSSLDETNHIAAIVSDSRRHHNYTADADAATHQATRQEIPTNVTMAHHAFIMAPIGIQASIRDIVEALFVHETQGGSTPSHRLEVVEATVFVLQASKVVETGTSNAGAVGALHACPWHLVTTTEDLLSHNATSSLQRQRIRIVHVHPRSTADSGDLLMAHATGRLLLSCVHCLSHTTLLQNVGGADQRAILLQHTRCEVDLPTLFVKLFAGSSAFPELFEQPQEGDVTIGTELFVAGAHTGELFSDATLAACGGSDYLAGRVRGILRNGRVPTDVDNGMAALHHVLGFRWKDVQRIAQAVETFYSKSRERFDGYHVAAVLTTLCTRRTMARREDQFLCRVIAPNVWRIACTPGDLTHSPRAATGHESLFLDALLDTHYGKQCDSPRATGYAPLTLAHAASRNSTITSSSSSSSLPSEDRSLPHLDAGITAVILHHRHHTSSQWKAAFAESHTSDDDNATIDTVIAAALSYKPEVVRPLTTSFCRAVNASSRALPSHRRVQLVLVIEDLNDAQWRRELTSNAAVFAQCPIKLVTSRDLRTAGHRLVIPEPPQHSPAVEVRFYLFSTFVRNASASERRGLVMHVDSRDVVFQEKDPFWKWRQASFQRSVTQHLQQSNATSTDMSNHPISSSSIPFVAIVAERTLLFEANWYQPQAYAHNMKWLTMLLSRNFVEYEMPRRVGFLNNMPPLTLNAGVMVGTARAYDDFITLMMSIVAVGRRRVGETGFGLDQGALNGIVYGTGILPMAQLPYEVLVANSYYGDGAQWMMVHQEAAWDPRNGRMIVNCDKLPYSWLHQLDRHRGLWDDWMRRQSQ